MLPVSITLQNASNLRDLGGWPTEDGRRVRPGLVFRAPALVNLSPEDQAAIARLGLRTVCDLRGERERAQHPVALPGATHLSLPIEPSVGAGLKDILRTGQVSGHVTPTDMMDLLRDAYRAYALLSFPQYRALFAELQRDTALPLLLHCSAGKDRTGFGAALLLRALGVPWACVVQDYLATNRLWRREITGNFALPPDISDVLLAAHENLLHAAFAAIDQQYGSLDAYLSQAIGLDEAARARLADRLLQA
jgi:protein-tyrosine phosphatase